jgi:hypothetical protein
MRRYKIVGLLVCFLAGIGLLAAVSFIPPLKNASGPGRVFEWAAVCLIGGIAVAIGLVAGYHYIMPSPPRESWSKHRPAKEILSTVPIIDMLRAERQFVLYGSSTGLVVLLTLLMYQNRQTGDNICRNLSPLIEYRDDSIWRYFPGALVKSQKQQQINQRVTIVKNVMASANNSPKTNHSKNGQPVNVPSENVNKPPDKPAEGSINIVRSIIGMHRDGRRYEDIVEALNAGIMKHRGTGTSQPIGTVNNNYP